MTHGLVTLYTTSADPYADDVRSYLREHGVEFEERLTDQSEDDATALRKAVGSLVVPVIVVAADGSKTGETVIIGYDQQRLDGVFDV